MVENLIRLVDTITKLAVELPRSTLEDVTRQILAQSEAFSATDLAILGVTPRAKELLRELGDAWLQNPDISAQAVAIGLIAAINSAERLASQQSMEIVWTGPSAAGSPLRRVDQVLYELIDGASRDLILTSYVTYEADRALKALQSAAERGVEVRLLMELADESGGKLGFDGLKPVKAKAPSARIFYWPLEKRRKDSRGRHGIFHAKCLVVDGSAALISSANLTDYGLEDNIELGLVVRGRVMASRLKEHFDQLILQGELKELT